jgi:hypothetical protein
LFGAHIPRRLADISKKRRKWQRGKSSERREPIWEPLLEVLPDDIDDFMWMGEVILTEGTQIQLYKHYWTRRYLCLDLGGRFWMNRENDRWEEAQDPKQMLRVVFAGRESRARIVRQNEWLESDEIEWARSATKHRIGRRRSLHVIRHAGICFEEVEWPRREFEPADPRITFLGDNEDGRELEVIAVLLEDGGLLVIHAMRMRERYGPDYAEALGWRE